MKKEIYYFSSPGARFLIISTIAFISLIIVKNCQSKYVFMPEKLFQTFHLHSSQQPEVAIESIQSQEILDGKPLGSHKHIRTNHFFTFLSFSNDS